MHLAHKPGMSLWSYRILQTISVFVLLAAEAVFLIVLVWLISGHGVIACGRGVFDDPNWAAYVVAVVGLPGAFMIGAGALFLWCANRADLTSQPVTD